MSGMSFNSCSVWNHALQDTNLCITSDLGSIRYIYCLLHDPSGRWTGSCIVKHVMHSLGYRETNQNIMMGCYLLVSLLDDFLHFNHIWQNSKKLVKKNSIFLKGFYYFSWKTVIKVLKVLIYTKHASSCSIQLKISWRESSPFSKISKYCSVKRPVRSKQYQMNLSRIHNFLALYEVVLEGYDSYTCYWLDTLTGVGKPTYTIVAKSLIQQIECWNNNQLD